MMTLKSSGATAHPWGTPVVIWKNLLRRPFTCIQLFVPLCSALRSLQYFSGRPVNSRIHRRAFWSTESNAARKSTKAINTFCRNSVVFSTICWIVKICSMVERSDIKPTCSGRRIFRMMLRHRSSRTDYLIPNSLLGEGITCSDHKGLVPVNLLKLLYRPIFRRGEGCQGRLGRRSMA